jgi:transposase
MSSSVSTRPSRLISDESWESVERLIPSSPCPSRGRTGRPRTSDRDVLEGIVLVLSSGIGWARLPAVLGYGSGWTCWRRMREWQAAGVFDEIHGALLGQMGHRRVQRWSSECLRWAREQEPDGSGGC